MVCHAISPLDIDLLGETHRDLAGWACAHVGDARDDFVEDEDG